jgi:hypothetical protein
MAQQTFPQPPVDPPEMPLCSWCDGTTKVWVHSIINASTDEPVIITLDSPGRLADYEIACPRCDGTGEEPKPDPLDDPRIP